MRGAWRRFDGLRGLQGASERKIIELYRGAGMASEDLTRVSEGLRAESLTKKDGQTNGCTEFIET